jgi:hypothetical protein
MDKINYKDKYKKYKIKYINIKGGSKSPTIIYPIKVRFFTITSNNSHSLPVNFTVNKDEINLPLKTLLEIKEADTRLAKLLNKYETNDDKFIQISGKKINNILEIKISDYLQSNLHIFLVSEEVTREIHKLKNELELISKNKTNSLIYISIASFLHTYDDLKTVIYQQFLPRNLLDYQFLSKFDAIYIFLIDGGFNIKIKKNNLILKKKEILDNLNMNYLSKKLIIKIIPSHVPDINKFIKSLNQYINDTTVIFSSVAGNDVTKA